MKKIIVSTLVVILVIFGIFVGKNVFEGYQKASETSKSNPLLQKITVGFDVEFPPMGYEENGKYVGFDIDLATLALKEVGLEPVFQPINWDSKEIELKNGEIDLIWNGLSWTKEREDSMELSEKYINNNPILLVNKQSGIKSIQDLKGKTIVAQKGGIGVDIINNNEALKTKFKDIIQVDSVVSMISEVEKGKADTAIIDAVNLYDVKKSGKIDKFIEIEIPNVDGTCVVAAKKGNSALIDKVNLALKKASQSGVTSSISNNWFGKDLSIKLNG